MTATRLGPGGPGTQARGQAQARALHAGGVGHMVHSTRGPPTRRAWPTAMEACGDWSLDDERGLNPTSWGTDPDPSEGQNLRPQQGLGKGAHALGFE